MPVCRAAAGVPGSPETASMSGNCMVIIRSLRRHAHYIAFLKGIHSSCCLGT